MDDNDHTLTSPLAKSTQKNAPVLCLSIIWHADKQRIGEQAFAAQGEVAVSRYLPTFRHPASADAQGIGHGGVSREPLHLRMLVQDEKNIGLEVVPPNSRMVVELNGKQIHAASRLSIEQLEAGAILSLGRTVLLCLHLVHSLPKHNPLPGLIGIGSAITKLRDQIRQVAATDSSVLLLGETGTGKELTAQAIHRLSERAQAPLVTVNMAALNESLAAADLFGAAKGAYTGAQQAREGLFAQAQNATLFLDEIGNAPEAIQPMLLRVLEGGDYRPLGASRDLHSNARIIAATDQNLYQSSFNQALLRRLESFIIHLPPLRARREDIGLLILHLLAKSSASAVPDFPASLVAELALYDWPGNVRQLTHVVKRCVMALQIEEQPDLASMFDQAPRSQQMPATIPAPVSDHAAPQAAANSYKKPAKLSPEEVLQAMQRHQWNILAAAQALGISRPSLYKLLDAHPDIRRAEHIGQAEIAQALAHCAGNLEACAAYLKTPSESLRRQARHLHLID